MPAGTGVHLENDAEQKFALILSKAHEIVVGGLTPAQPAPFGRKPKFANPQLQSATEYKRIVARRDKSIR